MFVYGLAFLIGLGALIAITNLYWENHPLQPDFLWNNHSLVEANEISEVTQETQHLHQEDEEHHEETIIQLNEQQIQKMGLEFQTAGPGTLFFSLSTRGKIILHPDHLAHIIPKISGVALEINKNIGNFVKKHEVMAVLESRDMADIKASYLAALSKTRLTASILEREQRLYQEKISPEQDYLNAKNLYEESLINVQLATQKLRAFGLDDEEINLLANQKNPDLRLYQVRSPIDGTVIMRHITQGEFVENTTTIFEVADLNNVWVEIGIYPKDISRIKEGQVVEVLAPNENKSYPAHLFYVSSIVSDKTIAAKAIAELDNKKGIWKPGIFVQVNIATEKLSFPLIIPKEAVQNHEDQNFVFVVSPEGFEKRLVKIGQSDKDNVEIISGLNAGEKFVANQTFLLKAELGKSSAQHEH